MLVEVGKWCCVGVGCACAFALFARVRVHVFILSLREKKKEEGTQERKGKKGGTVSANARVTGGMCVAAASCFAFLGETGRAFSLKKNRDAAAGRVPARVER